MTDKVLYQQDGGIVTLTLNDPAMRNPISERGAVDAI
ncbi:MAG: enoyl-CoA hydratase, partial [Acetobacteraceae bacterium]|nr:enoyl-CoA hydratase [Acetobacteraceae bacterium]